MADYRVDALVPNNGTATLAAQGLQADADIPCLRDSENLIIYATNSDAQTATLTFVAGDGLNSGQGNLAVTVAQNEVKFISGLESQRFTGADGKVQLLGTIAGGGTLTNCKLQIVQRRK